jgi:hypothetical protein
MGKVNFCLAINTEVLFELYPQRGSHSMGTPPLPTAPRASLGDDHGAAAPGLLKLAAVLFAA